MINANLNAYVAETLKNDESPVLINHSVDDHIHMMFRLSKKIALAKICLWQACSLLMEKGTFADLGRTPQAGLFQSFGLKFPLHDC